MDNIKGYIRKNPVFVSLLSVLIVITLGLTFYLYITYESNKEPVTPIPTPVEKLTAKITSFEGTYGKDGQVHLTWSVASNDDTITSVKLYNKDTQLGGEMKSLNSFPLPQSVYQFPTGDNIFKLKVSIENGEDIDRDISVFIDYVLDVKMNKETSEQGYLIKLSYSYSKDTDVEIPRISLTNPTRQPFEYNYVDTTRQAQGDFINATTTYHIISNQVAKGSYDINIRWIFDGINSSYDYPLRIEK